MSVASSTKASSSRRVGAAALSATDGQEPGPLAESNAVTQSTLVIEYEHVIARSEQQKWDIRTHAHFRGSADNINVEFPSLGEDS